MKKGNTKTLIYNRSIDGSLYSLICEAQTQLINYQGLYKEIRILSESGKCLRIVKLYK